MMRRRSLILATAVLFLLVGSALADTLVLKDGRRYEGRVLRRTPRKVFFEIHRAGMKVTMSFDVRDIKSIVKGEIKPPSTKPKDKDKKKDKDGFKFPPEPKAPPIKKVKGPTYYVIPLHKQVGKYLTADLIERAFKDALKRKPKVVILEVDSPGGHIAEVDKVRMLIRRYSKRMRIIVYVKKDAISAAAIISLAAREIYVNPDGMIGAAYAFGITTGGAVVKLDEKIRSIWRANARRCAETGGHSSLLAEAMIDDQMELYVVEENGEPVIKEGKPPRNAKGAKVVTKRGKLLTMTASEAIASGLAKAKVDGYEELGEELGFDEWTEIKGLGRPLIEHWHGVIGKVEKSFKKIFEDFMDNLREVEVTDPREFPHEYRLGSDGYTSKSKKRWQKHAAECSRHLKKAEQNLVKLQELAKKYPQVIADNPDSIRNSQKQIEMFRKIITRGIRGIHAARDNRRGSGHPGGMPGPGDRRRRR